MLKKNDVFNIRGESIKPFSVLNKFGNDRSGKKIYKFNSLGYRGEEYDERAKMKIFIGGCSLTIGNGLNYEETWPYHFKMQIINNMNLQEKDVNVLNFANSGRSNDYICRTLLRQCEAVKPELIVALFTNMNRIEYVDKGMVSPILVQNGMKEECAINYYEYYTEEIGFINTMKNMLLLQYYCKLNRIKYIISFYELDKFSKKRYLYNTVCKQFLDKIDRKCFFKNKFPKVDLAADNDHPGPKSNKIYAEKLFEFFRDNIREK